MYNCNEVEMSETVQSGSFLEILEKLNIGILKNVDIRYSLSNRTAAESHLVFLCN